MSHWSRRDVLRISGGAAAATAIPIAVIGVTSATTGAAAPTAEAPLTPAELEQSGSGRVMVCVHDAAKGQVSLLQGSREKIIEDHQLVARLMRAARA
ncbi:MAG: twin-arginine translocation signal domain-containing protein [Ilumatobacteraceae bacterium]